MSRPTQFVTRQIIVLLLCAVVADGRYVPQGRLSEGGSLDRQIGSIDVLAATRTQHFLSALGRAESPGGIAIVRSCEREAALTLAPSGSSFRNALDAIARADSHYMWVEADSVVNLRPKTGYPPLLSLQVTSFEIDPRKPTSLLISELFALPEVRMRISQLGLHEGTYFGTMMTGEKSALEYVDVKPTRVSGVPLFSVLNQVVHLRGDAVWKYEETHCEGRAEFRVRALRN